MHTRTLAGSTPRVVRRTIAALAAATLAVAVLPQVADAAPGAAPGQVKELGIEVLSSAPDQVSGGDARVAVTLPPSVKAADVRVRLGDTDVTDAFTAVDGGLEGVVDGMTLGENVLVAEAVKGRGNARVGHDRWRDEVTLVNHPAEGPIFSGPHQQPFVCRTQQNGLGQPLADNDDGIGVPVGGRWSKNCSAETVVDWRYRTTGGGWSSWTPGSPLPSDIATASVLDGPDEVPFLVRRERGTSNRFIYSIATLVDPAAPDEPVWNDRLVFSLQGGVAIGRTQGSASEGAQLLDHALAKGYAVVNSTGLRTNTHYNLQLGGETALMLKEKFVVQYGVPDYTVGVGGSGGAIQQYVYAQNHPGLLDALVPQYSYPDMVTQTIHVGDCELLEYFMDVVDKGNPKWRQPAYRQALQGLHVTDHPRNWSSGSINSYNGLAQAYQAFGIPLIDRAADSPLLSGQGECRKGWQGLLPLAMNPTFTNVGGLDTLAQDISGVEWTHWADLVNIYGTDASGYARVPWDNVGVQYGLRAFVDGVITADEFVNLNATVGGWKPTSEMVQEGFPFTTSSPTPTNFDPWSRRNTIEMAGDVAPRREGDVLAIERAHSSGMVYRGDIDIPIIDWRPYLEHELDMHNSHQSFAVRQRMLAADGDADNLVVWFTDARPQAAFDQTPMAFEVIDEWMANIAANPQAGVAANRPDRAVDSCFATDGSLIASGEDVWAGILDDGPDGACTQAFPTYTTSRIEAGAPIDGDVFKCETKPLAQALTDGTYGERAAEFTAAQLARLERTFPQGVCDYGRPPIRG
ncbi:DUF6351 family protein [Egicoccus sp. AB-alg2]|uniref:DUF6351 family protein n=1 Tax=Egicoccus sp. AB-alg2 TaxID=3242693 RepID=UPI00359DA248